MSGGLDVLSLREDDVTKMLAACTHLGSENVNFQVRLTGIVELMFKQFNINHFNNLDGTICLQTPC